MYLLYKHQIQHNMNIFSFRKRSLRFVSNIHHAIIRWVVVNCEEFGCLLGRGREIWNWIWVEFGINGRFMKYFFKNCLGTPCYLIVVSGGFFFLNKDTRRCFLECLHVSSSSSLLFDIEFWSTVRIKSFSVRHRSHARPPLENACPLL